MASVSVKFKLPDGSTYSDSIGYSYFFGINPNVVVEEANAINKIIGTLENQKKKLNNILAGSNRAGDIKDDYIDYAYTDEFVDCIKERVDWLEKTINKLKTARDNLQALASEYSTRWNSLTGWQQNQIAPYVLSGDRRNG